MNTFTTNAPPSRTLPALVAAALVASTLATVAPAAAASPSAPVRYDDLDLTNDAGFEALHRRLDAAATRVCTRRAIGDLHPHASTRDCRRAVVERAAATVPNAAFAAWYAARGSHARAPGAARLAGR